MKRLIKSITGLVLGCVVLLTAATAWAVQPIKYTPDPSAVPEDGQPPIVMLDCAWFGMDFLVLGEWVYNEYGQFHFDQEGSLVMINAFTYLTEQRVWNSTDLNKYLTGDDVAGKTEHSHFIMTFDQNEDPIFFKESGVFTKMVVPGYGQIRLSSGHMQWVFVGPNEWNWELVNATPNTSPTIEDAYALCAYLE